MLNEVDVAPKLLNYVSLDSLTSQENFIRNLRSEVAKNLEIIIGPNGIERAFVQFIVKSNGKVKVKNASGTSKKAIKHAFNAVKKINKMIPAMKDGKAVPVKFTIPVKFNTININ